MKIFTRFHRHRRAVAAVEFALAVPVLAWAFAGATDFTFAQWRRSALSSAVAQGAYYTFRTGPTVSTTTVQSLVQNAAAFSGVSVNTIAAPACYCPAGTPAVLGSTVACGSTCTDNSTAGQYLTITATYTLSSFFPGHSLYNLIGGAAISDSVTVRLQ
jgi:Flp pilus assembly protein TadG